MVHILKEDRDSLQFLWIEDLFEDSKPKPFSFSQLVFGLTPAPAIFGTVITHHLYKFEAIDPHTIELLRQSLYVDDWFSVGISSVEKVYHLSKQTMLKAGINLSK